MVLLGSCAEVELRAGSQLKGSVSLISAGQGFNTLMMVMFSGHLPDHFGQMHRSMNFNAFVAPAFTGYDADIGFCNLEGFGDKSN
jgi:hypothetical protein